MPSATPPRPLPDSSTLSFPVVTPSETPHATYGWENLAFEGGGAKGYAYIGAVKCLEERGIYPHHIRRVAGTSIGSLFAVLTSIGCPTDYMVKKVPTDFQALAKDGSGGNVRSVARAARRKGMHPGQKLFDFLGDILLERTGSADITFAQVLERYGREVCITVTNVTRMMTEYCHPKTTPDMPIRVAARISMSLPVLLQPIMLQGSRSMQSAGMEPEYYVDGGLLCNNPTHVFDGWWLSLDPRDAFLRRMQPLSRAHEHYPRSARFNPANGRTLGFTLFAGDETDITRGWLRDGAAPPPRPSTKSADECKQKEQAKKRAESVQAPLQKLLHVLDDVDADTSGTISLTELEQALVRSGVSDAELTAVFGTTAPDEIFARINTNGNDQIEFSEVLVFLESVGVDVTTQLVGFPARPPKNMLEFALNMLEAVSRDLTRANHTSDDYDRTIPINTDYVGTTTFDLVQEDLDFLISTGFAHTSAFLDDYDKKRSA
ncbi:MAG: hypothetical protein RL419_1619 [Actinomycetota bacterium]